MDAWANIEKCVKPTGSGFYWWCGETSATTCKIGNDASTFPVAAGVLQTIITEPEAAISTSIKATSAFSSTTSITSSSASLIAGTPVTIMATVTSPTRNNGGSDRSDKTPVAIGAGVGIPLGIAALGFLGFLIRREQNLGKQRRGDKAVPRTTQQEYSPTNGAATILQRSPVPPFGELMGDMAESELVAPAPVHEMYTKPGS